MIEAALKGLVFGVVFWLGNLDGPHASVAVYVGMSVAGAVFFSSVSIKWPWSS